jgi:copper resistance protein C
MFRKRFFIRAVLLGLVLVGGISTANAHAFPDHSEPAVGSTLNLPPMRVRVWFTEALEGAFSSMIVTDSSGHAVVQGKATVDPKDPKLLEVNLVRLTAGTYRVKWRAVSVDTHTTEGDFTFTIKP